MPKLGKRDWQAPFRFQCRFAHSDFFIHLGAASAHAQSAERISARTSVNL
jgi:hypothetical protein